MKNITLLPQILTALLLIQTGWAETSALNTGLPASFDPAPNYSLCTDDGDPMQLSDGTIKGQRSKHEGKAAILRELMPGLNPDQRAARALWGLPSTVGWAHARKPILISFDLGESRRIGGLTVSAAAGTAGVYWPAAVAIVVSEDGENWSYAGELTSRSRKNGLPPAMGYSEHQFVVDDLNIEGRFVGICIHTGGSPMFFTDEIEVLAGDSSKPADVLPALGDIGAVREFVQKNTVGYAIQRRLALDYSLIQSAIRNSSLDAEKKTGLEAQLASLEAACNEIPEDLPEKFRTVIPINDAEAKLLSLYGSLLSELGYPSLLVSKIHRNAYLGWLKTPEDKTQAEVELSFRQMRDEARGDLLLLTNASSQAQKVALSVSPTCDAMTVFYCPWTDTPQLEPTATALLPATQTDSGWEFEIPAGLTMKVWVSVDGSKLPVGKQDFKLSFAGTEKIEVAMKTDISPVAMGAERLHLGMWDYTAGAGVYDLTPKNRDAAIRLMRSHGVDSPWGKPSTLPPAKAEDFDGEDHLVGKLDFTEFDEWLALWPDARRYMIFVNVSPHIGGIPFDSPRFPKRVAQWARAIADHAAAKGIKPGQLNLLLVDEPYEDQHDELLVAWAKPLKEVVDGLSVWNEPVWKDPQAASHPQAFTLPDVLCPNWGILDAGGEAQWDFYKELRQEGKPMELYMCSALAPHTDPNRYYRLMPWAGWKLRIQGLGFWAFSDQGGLKDAWNAYGETNGAIWYTPAFLGESDATDTLQWQAVREGMLDYEYLRQLEKCLPDIKNKELKGKAEHLLSEKSIKEVFHGLKGNDGFAWQDASDWDAPDIYREKILAALEEIHRGKDQK